MECTFGLYIYKNKCKARLHIDQNLEILSKMPKMPWFIYPGG